MIGGEASDGDGEQLASGRKLGHDKRRAATKPSIRRKELKNEQTEQHAAAKTTAAAAPRLAPARPLACVNTRHFRSSELLLVVSMDFWLTNGSLVLSSSGESRSGREQRLTLASARAQLLRAEAWSGVALRMRTRHMLKVACAGARKSSRSSVAIIRRREDGQNSKLQEQKQSKQQQQPSLSSRELKSFQATQPSGKAKEESKSILITNCVDSWLLIQADSRDKDKSDRQTSQQKPTKAFVSSQTANKLLSGEFAFL